MSNDVHCPYCKYKFTMNDLICANLFGNEDEEVVVKCPESGCKHKFHVNVVLSISYEVKSAEEYAEDEGFY